MPSLNDKDILLLEHVSKKSSISQRELSKKTGISLGLINVILKKLIRTGHLKASQLNTRKLEYLLTPQGFLEAAKKTYEYTISTIRKYKIIESNLSLLLKELHRSGYDYFSIHGDGELKDLIESTLQKSLEEIPVTLGREHRKDQRAIVLNLTMDPLPEGHTGDVLNVVEKIGH
jgi:DNA-binding Lrp family transcriptional regulator